MTTAAGTAPPPMSFNTPEGFFVLPLAGAAEDRAERAELFARGLYSRGDEEIWAPAAPYYAALGEFLADGGVTYAALGLFSTADTEDAEGAEDARPARYEASLGVAQCAFTLAAVPTDQSDPDVAAQGLYALLSQDEYNDVDWLDLPCGPAVTRATVSGYRLRPELTGDGEERELLTGEIQAHVPFPRAPFTAVFTLHTASMDHWAAFRDMMTAILHTVEFPGPAEA
ncbi:hypothetical protein [Streptomyces spectabilis]|uniref:Uncharacterized protein n=1 Tax=Streptomyces spectabilis TaxID=68270 RepID=A0A516RBL3_STRST|nr:hypothetical protein [Streptomyces spectabilis]QDQ13044.1 hypothetical protein FH965_22820 [Streptomyces spectabilis]